MLTVKQIEAAKPKENHTAFDGNGLYLYVPVSGKRYGSFATRLTVREKILTIGKYPLMTLQEARDKAWTARKDISVGIDPVKAKRLRLTTIPLVQFTRNGTNTRSKVWSVGYATELAKMFDDDIFTHHRRS